MLRSSTRAVSIGISVAALIGFSSAGALAAEFVARHDLPSSAYQQEFDRLIGQGFRLMHVSGYNTAVGERFAAIFEKRGGPAFVARHGLTSAGYQAEFDTLVSEGFRPTVVSGYGAGGSERFAAIFEKKGGPEFVARHGLTSGAYQAEFDRLVGQGFRPVLVNGYNAGVGDRFAAIFEKRSGGAFVARHGLTSAAYQAEFDSLVGQGFRPTVVSCYDAGGEHFAAIFEKKGGPAFVARHGLTSAAYQAEFDKLLGQGFRPVLVNGCGVGGSHHFVAIWEK
jgi:Bacterial tandem repeat domain 1